jgi:hypothetical protein
MGGEVEELIWLNGEETADIQRFFTLGRGIPMIRASSRLDKEGGSCRVDNPRDVMETIIHIMEKNCSHGSNVLPPLVENLGQLMSDLGNAAWVVRRQSRWGNMQGSD